jgi:hypothetical protein
MDFGLWETVNRENPPQSVSLSVNAVGEVRTERRNDLDIALSRENYIQQFLFAALYAYGDLLLDKRTTPTDAVREFEQHADELLQEAFDRKWLFGLRRLELLEAEFAERFWPMQREVVEEARYEFEEDVWSTDDEPAGESGPRRPAKLSWRHAWSRPAPSTRRKFLHGSGGRNRITRPRCWSRTSSRVWRRMATGVRGWMTSAMLWTMSRCRSPRPGGATGTSVNGAFATTATLSSRPSNTGLE